MMLRRASFALTLLLAVFGTASAQDPLGWNAPRALELIERARVRRTLPIGDTALLNYQAKANGYVYFYLDRREDDERTLVKVDQIALDLFWKRPDLSKQRIVGLRDVSRLPNRMYYHLDHLTIVHNFFGNIIRLGDGDEVRDVPHPAAPGGDSIYDYRLADSVTLQLGGGQPEVRVYEIQVRPKRSNRSAFIGSVFVDRATADLVRMTFTFTPASYVDRRLDYINISLDNGLFGGKYWLPNEQSVEIRRQIPELDFAAGAIIKGRFRVGEYRFNEQLADSIFWGRPVSAVPEEQRENYPFPTEIYAGVNEEGLAPPPQMEDLRARAKALIGEARLSGLPPWRVYIPNASSVLRHNEAEGWYGGIGATYVPSPTFRTDFTGGYAFGAERPELGVGVHFRPPDVDIGIRAYFNNPRDIGPFRGMPGVLNTFISGFGGRDYTNTYFTTGVSLELSGENGPNRTDVLRLRVEQHRPGSWGDQNTFLEPVSRGNVAEAALGTTRNMPEEGGLRWAAGGELGYKFFSREQPSTDYDTQGLRVLGFGEVRANSEDLRRTLIGRLDAGSDPSDETQYSFLLGGQETLPAFPYRSIDASAFILGRLELAHTLSYPWVRLRLTGAGSYANEIGTAGDVVGVSRRIRRISGGAGVGLLWDVIRVDVVNGVRFPYRGGFNMNEYTGWKTIVSIRRDFWDML